MDILYKSKNALVLKKDAGIPSQPDKTCDTDVITMASEVLKYMGEDCALWLVHRLDRVVSGLLVFARNKKTAAELSFLVQNGGIGKEYYAVVEGDAEGGTLRDYLYKDSAKAKAFVTDRARQGVKEAILEYIPLKTVVTEKGVRTLVKIKLLTGRYHQIRAQFSSRGMPITGDKKYGSRDNTARFPALFAYRLSINTKNEKINIEILPELSEYPWSLFSSESYKGN